MTPERREYLMNRYEHLPPFAWDELRHGSEEAARAAELRAVNFDIDREARCIARRCAYEKSRGDIAMADLVSAELRKLRDAAVKMRGRA